MNHNQHERNIKSGQMNGHAYQLKARSTQMVVAGAAPYALYVDGAFYCTCENYREAMEQIESIYLEG